VRHITYISFFISFLLGLFISELITGRPQGPTSSLTNYPNQKLPSLFIGLGISKIERAYHIHHWMYGLALLLISLIFNKIEIAGFFLGVTLQGMTYKDRFHIRVPLCKGKS